MGIKLKNEELEELGFFTKQCRDGIYWLYRAGPERFLQVSETNRRADLYDNGWVENNLTDEEFDSAYKQLRFFNEEYCPQRPFDI